MIVCLKVFAIEDQDEQERKITLYALLFVGLGVISLITYFMQVSNNWLHVHC